MVRTGQGAVLTTLSQTLVLVGGAGLHRRLMAGGNRIQQMARSGRSDEDILEELYWTALSRAPSAEETTACLQQIPADGDRSAALRQVAWALLNAKEFIFRH